MKTKIAASLLALSALLFSAATAAATPGQDSEFWDILLANDIVPGPQAVQHARTICAALWSGRADVWDAVDAVYQDNDLSYDDATVFVASAIRIYCPPSDTA